MFMDVNMEIVKIQIFPILIYKWNSNYIFKDTTKVCDWSNMKKVPFTFNERNSEHYLLDNWENKSLNLL